MISGKLTLEILNGPLDGQTITLEAAAEWTKAPAGPLSFPWDEELGQPQAQFILEAEGWSLAAIKSPHGTYRVDQNERLKGGDKIQLAQGNLLKASQTWLLVR